MRGNIILTMAVAAPLVFWARELSRQAPADAPPSADASAKTPGPAAPSRAAAVAAPSGEGLTAEWEAAQTAYREGDLAAARRLLEALLARDEHQPAFYHLLGRVHYDTGRAAEAVRVLERGLARAPGDARIAALLARGRREAGLSKGVSLFFDFHYDGTGRLDLRAESVPLAHMLDAAYAHVGRELRFFPRDRVQVVLYDAADFRAALRPDAWAGGLYDGKIRVPVGDFAAERRRLARVLTHEYTHAVVHRIAPGCPPWLNEGLAQLMDGADPAAARRRLRAGPRLSAARLRRPFRGLDAARARAAYDMSLVLTEALRARYSYFRIVDYLRDLDGSDADAAFKKRFFVDFETFVAEQAAE